MLSRKADMKTYTSRATHFLFIIITIFLIIACSAPQEEQTPSEIDTTAPASIEKISTKTAAPEPIPAASNTARYELTFNATWSAGSHPENFDTNAHFSPFITQIHNNSPEAAIFQPGALASAGMEQMAETGETTLLESEIELIISAGNSAQFIKGKRIDSPGVNTGTFDISQDFSHILFVSMIAPSPDWFVAAEVNLFVDDQWIKEVELPLVSYDSGTDNGTTLTAVDSDTNPKELIFQLGKNLQSMGLLTLVRID